MKKSLSNLQIVAKDFLSADTVRLILKGDDNHVFPEIKPGQFVNVAIPNCGEAYLRRPISVNRFDSQKGLLHLVVKMVGKGTRALGQLQPGDVVNVLLPLGNGFPTEDVEGKKILIIGGGVGIAPLLYYGDVLKAHAAQPTFLLGARKADDVVLKEEFEKIAQTFVTTEDGSLGSKGFVTAHEVLSNDDFDFWVCCGPMPMMKAVASLARNRNKDCFVSLENTMACGLGACLCCVEKTVRGNECVCTSGPVFNINELTW